MPKKILLADDSITIQKVIAITFANEDFALTVTDNGDDALKKAREVRPDIVLADVVMPGKSGYDVCEAVKQDPQLRYIPVLLLTGTFEAFDEEKARKIGADGWISKPFESQALIDKVTELFSRAGERRAAPPPPRAAAPRPAAPPPSLQEFGGLGGLEEEGFQAIPVPEEDVDLAAKQALQLDEFEEFMDTGQGALSPPPPEKSIGFEAVPLPEEEKKGEEVWGETVEESFHTTPAPPAVGEEEEISPSQPVMPVTAEEPPVHSYGIPEAYETTFESADLGASEQIETPAVETPPPPPPQAISEPPPLQVRGTEERPKADLTALQGVPESVIKDAIREAVEKVVWEVVPDLAEALIQEEIKKLKSKQQ